jgi:hypothetical protein
VRIVLVIPVDPAARFGGSPHRARFWRSSLAPLGELTTIVLPVLSEPPEQDDEPQLGALITIPTMELTHPRHPWLARVMPEYLGARWATELPEFDLVVGFKSFVAPFCAGLASASGAPIIIDLDDDEVALHVMRGEHQEADRFRALIDDITPAVHTFTSATGFGATVAIANTYAPGERPVLASPPRTGQVTMVGAFGYGPNIDGARWLTDEVWPKVLARRSDARIQLIGKYSDELPHGVGFVDDLDAVYAATSVVVAPLLSGSGTRIKILEAWAQGVPVVSTPIGIEGLGAHHRQHALIAADAATFADHIVELLERPELGPSLANSAHAHLALHFEPARQARLVRRLVERATFRPVGPVQRVGLATAEVEDGLAIHEPTLDVAHHLNPIAAVVFVLCDGHTSVDQIAESIGTMLGVGDPLTLVTTTIAELVDKRLIELPRPL